MKDSIADGVKVVKWIFVGIKRDEIVNLQWGISITIDNSKSLARVIIKIVGHGGSDLFVGDIGEAEDRFERIAQRLGAVDLLAEEKPVETGLVLAVDDVIELYTLAVGVGEAFASIRRGESDPLETKTRELLEQPYIPLARKIEALMAELMPLPQGAPRNKRGQ